MDFVHRIRVNSLSTKFFLFFFYFFYQDQTAQRILVACGLSIVLRLREHLFDDDRPQDLSYKLVLGNVFVVRCRTSIDAGETTNSRLQSCTSCASVRWTSLFYSLFFFYIPISFLIWSESRRYDAISTSMSVRTISFSVASSLIGFQSYIISS